MITCPLQCEITVENISTLVLTLSESSDIYLYAPQDSSMILIEEGSVKKFSFQSTDKIDVVLSCDVVELLVASGTSVHQKQRVARLRNIAGSIGKLHVLNRLCFFVLNGTRADYNTPVNKFFTKIILTIPHMINTKGQRCEVRDVCDSMAQKAALVFVEALKSTAIPHSVIEGDVNRLRKDLNRKESRNVTAFRRSLRSEISERTFVLDVHSFPADFLWDAKKENIGILLIDYPGHAHLLEHFMQLSVLTGVQNDIQDEVHEQKGGSALIEVNEAINETALDKLGSSFVKFASIITSK